jgi:hypothetical protein
LHVELAVDVIDVALGRADGNDQCIGDCLIGVTIGEQPQHLQLASGQRLDEC